MLHMHPSEAICRDVWCSDSAGLGILNLYFTNLIKKTVSFLWPKSDTLTCFTKFKDSSLVRISKFCSNKTDDSTTLNFDDQPIRAREYSDRLRSDWLTVENDSRKWWVRIGMVQLRMFICTGTETESENLDDFHTFWPYWQRR